MISIYLDVLLITNIYVNYFLLKATAKITHTSLKTARCILGAVFGSLSALIILLPAQNSLIMLFIKLICAVAIIFVTFFKISFKRLIKLTLVFFAINFAFAGILTLIYTITNLKMLVVNNYCVYFDIPIIFFAVATIISYFAICIVTHIIEKNFNINHSYKILVEIFGKQYLFNAICDSGNSLSDSFSGKPVIICNSIELTDELNIDINENNLEESYNNLLEKSKKFRLVPYSTVKEKGLIPVIKPDKLYIKNDKNEIKPVDAFIGITNNENRRAEAIFNPCLLI